MGRNVKKSKHHVKAAAPKKRLDWGILLGAAVIVLGTIIIYLPAIRAGTIWDDDDYVINNATLRTASGLVDIWTRPSSLPQWYPMVHTTFWIEYHLWGLWWMGFHLVNVLLHIISALLLWRLLRWLKVPGAWLGAAIFAMHPVQVETVAWITERKNLLAGVFYLLSMMCYLRWDEARSSTGEAEKKRPSYGLWIGALVFFAAALFSKTVVATMPAAILVIIWWRRGTIRLRDITPLIPFFILGAGLGMLTAWLEVHHVGARSDMIAQLDLSPLQRVLIAGRAVTFYATKLVAPWPLMFIYRQWTDISPAVWWQWLFPLGVAGVIIVLIAYRNRIGRGPAAAVMIFCGTLFPALGFMNVYPMRFSYVADHFQYHAAVALIVLAAAGIWKCARVYGSAVLIPLAVITILRTPAYHDAETLFRTTLAQNDGSWMVYTRLGMALTSKAIRTGDERYYDEATEYFNAALRLDPGNHETHSNVAMMLAREKKYDQAIAEFEKTTSINPLYAPAYFGLGEVYKRMGQTDQAVQQYEKALAIRPRYPEANYAMGQIKEKQGLPLDAVEYYRQAVAAQPEDADYRYNLGTVLINLKQYPEAVHNLRQAVRIRPGWPEAWVNLGSAQFAMGQRGDAVSSFQTALRIKPDFAPARMMLQRALRP